MGKVLVWLVVRAAGCGVGVSCGDDVESRVDGACVEEVVVAAIGVCACWRLNKNRTESVVVPWSQAERLADRTVGQSIVSVK